MDGQPDPLPPSNFNSQSNANTNPLPRNGVRDDSVPISEDTVAAAGFNVQNPIMNALIGNIKGILPVKKTPNANAVRCEVCNCEMSSDVVMSFHINGAKHKKKMKALEIVNQLKESGERGLELGKEDDPNAFRCEICSLTVNSAQQLEIHVAGAKHRNKAAKAGLSVPDLSNVASSSVPVSDIEQGGPPSKKKKKEETTLYCQTCQITVNSQLQYDQHLVSKKHQNKLSPQKNNPPNRLKQKQPNMRFVNFRSGGKQTFDTRPQAPFNEGNERPNQPENFNNQGNFVKPGNSNNLGNFEPTGNFNNPGNFKKPRNFNNLKNLSNPESVNDYDNQSDVSSQDDFQKPSNSLLTYSRFKITGPPNYPGNFKNPRNEPDTPKHFKNPGHFQTPNFKNDSSINNYNNNNSNNNFNHSRNCNSNNYNRFNSLNNKNSQDLQNQNHDRMGTSGKNINNNSGQLSNYYKSAKKSMQNSDNRGFRNRNAVISPGNNQQNNRNFSKGPFLSKGALPPPPPPPPFLLS